MLDLPAFTSKKVFVRKDRSRAAEQAGRGRRVFVFLNPQNQRFADGEGSGKSTSPFRPNLGSWRLGQSSGKVRQSRWKPGQRNGKVGQSRSKLRQSNGKLSRCAWKPGQCSWKVRQSNGKVRQSRWKPGQCAWKPARYDWKPTLSGTYARRSKTGPRPTAGVKSESSGQSVVKNSHDTSFHLSAKPTNQHQ